VEVVPGQRMERALTVSSTNAAVVARQTGLRKEQLSQIKVPCMTLNQLIEKHSFYEPDVLQIDVEGHDLQVLKTIDLSKYRPKIIQFEHGHLLRREIVEAADFLTTNNYLLYYGGHQSDSVAMPKELIESVTFWPL
jgi:hypothetical protein